ncbi:MAG: sensor histidine kinase [Bacteroidetes bacterium]|jgi:two-component system phosphate regulon sensor histidine kinase PhoR|nr:sensor histidine kinase [Bacteroidota bacterium]
MAATNNRVSTIFSLAASVISSLVLYIGTKSFSTGAMFFLVFFAAYFVLFRVLHYVLVFRDLELIWENVRSLRREKSPHNPFDHTFSTKWIDDEVKLLIKEKATEIGKLKEVEQFRKDFLGNVAHELRTPVFGIQGYLHTLLDGAAADEATRQRFLEKAVKNADGLTAIIEDLITISRIETNQLGIDPTAFDLVELVDDVFDSLEYQAEKKGIHMVRKGLQMALVYADYQKIKQVLTNLVSNSLKYGMDGGSSSVSLFELKDKVMIEVADNGIGISKDDLPRIFERFYRVDKNRSRNQGASTGLGLSIVKHFIEAHNSEIKVRSSLGKGTIFSFTLAKNNDKTRQLSMDL